MKSVYESVIENDRLAEAARCAARNVQLGFREIEQHDEIVCEIRFSKATLDLLLMTSLFALEDLVAGYPNPPQYLYSADIVIDNTIPQGEVVANAERSAC